MLFTNCENCNVELKVDTGDCYAGGLKDYEEYICPKCNKIAGKVKTSGKPTAYLMERED